MLIFITSLRHPENARDWNHVLDLLDRTLQSVCRQTEDDFQVIVVYNKDSRLRSSQPGVIYHPVDLPPNRLYDQGSATEDGRNAFRLDRGMKYLAGLYRARDFSGGRAPAHVMFFDADDCVSLRLAEFVNRSPQHDGWYMDQGYLYKEGACLAYHLRSRFSRICGTCHVIRYDRFCLPERMEDVSPEFVRRALGSHIFIQEMLSGKGIRLTPLPFPGAVYMIGHGDNHGKIPGYRTLIDGYDGGSRGVRGTLRMISRFRLLTRAFRREFGIHPLPGSGTG